MKVLDLDMDYFLDYPVNECNPESEERVTLTECIESVWSEYRVRSFLEDNLGLSREKPLRGRIFKAHSEVLYFWDELIQKGRVKTPFSVIHVDSHADLGFGCLGNRLG